jgi:sulfate adenylyltransferase subunit 2
MIDSNFPQLLEDEAIYILREAAAQFENPAILFSGGKDSITLVHLARKAFYPARIPFALVHVDTGHNFPEVITFRDELAESTGAKLIVRSVEETIKKKKLREESGRYASRNALQTHTLLEVIEELKLDACIGGGRRDEEKARAKERLFSVRDEFGQWNAKHQRPELFSHLNGRIEYGQNVRVFPISNWTELDVWNYIKRENIAVPSIYFSHQREVFVRDGLIWPVSPVVYKEDHEEVASMQVRFRTVGDMTCTAAVSSEAYTIDEIIKDILAADVSERGARIDDKRSEAAMENRKRSGYF